ncbi:Intraflagellar transport protein 122-like [Symbiodinium microadriaticum]|uniref:Intraflagellar transport protein 122-like n=1 Tax=Symbiodinium microadriaticum TaxID=2951 RepID=A0A1Q9DZ25_SYMMI|nr:Intraflagellar transport protein 122-like [Symbiodinium microadriaticum]
MLRAPVCVAYNLLQNATRQTQLCCCVAGSALPPDDEVPCMVNMCFINCFPQLGICASLGSMKKGEFYGRYMGMGRQVSGCSASYDFADMAAPRQVQMDSIDESKAFRQQGSYAFAKEATLISLHMENHRWDEAFQLSNMHPEYAAQIYLPWAMSLVHP